MSKAILICPDQREALKSIIGDHPVAMAIFIGKPLIDHALYGLKHNGVTELLLLTSDRPAQIRHYVRDGAAWGIQIHIQAQPRELDGLQAQQVHPNFTSAPVSTLDSLPQSPDTPILESPATWHGARKTLLPIIARQQIGTREIKPGVWIGLRTRIAPSAELNAPCWIGHRCTISSCAVIGPDAFIENDSLVDAQAEVTDSTIGHETYLGEFTYLANSIAYGAELINWGNNAHTQVTAKFLISKLNTPPAPSGSLRSRLSALIAITLSLPILPLAFVAATLRGRPWKIRKNAILPRQPGEPQSSIDYALLPGLPGKWKQWPILWRIVTGHFSWVGNPPLTIEQAAELESEFEQLWITIPPALFTAPEAEGSRLPWDDEAKAHAALFAANAHFKWRCKILVKGIQSLLACFKRSTHEFNDES